jgi:hypothetical protein
MKTTLRSGFVPALLLLLFAVSAVAQTPDPARVTVNWAPNDQLSEVRQNSFQRGYMEPAQWQKALGDYLRKRAERLLPAGERLKVTIDDIKLAGGFEPWHDPLHEDIRYMRDIYPPRIDLHYTLIGADGATIREGANKLRDLSYLYHSSLPSDSDLLRYDKRLIGEWLSAEFRRGKS